MKKLITFIFLVAISSSLPAQVQLPTPPPQGPLLKRVPAFYRWVITFKLQEGTSTTSGDETTQTKKKPLTSRPSTTVVTKGSDTVFEQTTNENGVTVEKWHASGCVVTGVNGKDWVLSPGAGNTFDSADYSTTDFPGFGWISLMKFSGMQDVMGRRCLVFKDKITTMDPAEIAVITSIKENEIALDRLKQEALAKGNDGTAPHADNQEVTPMPPLDLTKYQVNVTAYIDDETRLPVGLIYETPNGTMTRIYQFQAPPSSPLSVPPDVQKMIDANKKREKGMSVRSAPL